MKAKEFIPVSKPRNFVAKNQQTAGAGAHKDKKRAEKQGDVKHKAKQFEEDAVADFLARGGEIQHGKFRKPRKSEKTDYGSKHIGGQRDAVAGKAGKTLGRAAATNFKGGGKPVVGATYRGEDVEERLNDDPWGDQGRFAGDTKVNIGGTTLKKIESGDTVSYFGEKAKVVDVNYTSNYARISANGKTLNVKLSDLKRVGRGVAEVSKATIDRYVSKASDAHGDADFKARMSKNDPDKRSYHVDQKKTTEKRRQGISRALDRMSREESVSEATSVAVRMQRAANKQRAKSDASLARTPSSIPKKEEPKKS